MKSCWGHKKKTSPLGQIDTNTKRAAKIPRCGTEKPSLCLEKKRFFVCSIADSKSEFFGLMMMVFSFTEWMQIFSEFPAICFPQKPPNISVFSAFFRKFVSARIREDELWGCEQQARKASQMRRREIGFFHRQFPINPRLVKEFKSFSPFLLFPYTPRGGGIFPYEEIFSLPMFCRRRFRKSEFKNFPLIACQSFFCGKTWRKEISTFFQLQKIPRYGAFFRYRNRPINSFFLLPQ